MNRRWTVWVVGALAACIPTVSSTQVLLDGTDSLDFDRPEAWAMQYFASLNVLTGFGPPQELSPGTVVVGFEVDSVPSLDERELRVGFNGTKTEDINRTSVFGRPRVAVGLAGNFILEGSYLPPIDISGVEPDLMALALSRPLPPTQNLNMGLRIALQHGTFSGDFTCSADEIAKGPNTFGCEVPSDDEMTVDTSTLEFAISRRLGDGERFAPYASVAVSYMDLDFQVRADYRGLNDRTRLVASGTTYSVAAGLARHVGERWRWAGEVFYSPLDVVRPPATSTENDAFLNARLMLTYRARR